MEKEQFKQEIGEFNIWLKKHAVFTKDNEYEMSREAWLERAFRCEDENMKLRSDLHQSVEALERIKKYGAAMIKGDISQAVIADECLKNLGIMEKEVCGQ